MGNTEGERCWGVRSKLSKCQWIPVRVGGVLAVLGGILVHLTLGTQLTYGNTNPYFISYIRKFSSPASLRYIDGIWIEACAQMGRDASMIVGGLLEQKLGQRMACFIGCCTVSLGVFLTFFSVQYAFFTSVLTYGVLFGFGCGIAYPTPLTCAFKWFPQHAGLISGIIFMGFGCGSVIFNLIITMYLNPTNITPDQLIEEDLYFTQDSVLYKLPDMFLILGIIYAVMQSTGVLFMFTPPTDPSLEPLVSENGWWTGSGGASNAPLRDKKSQLLEGATRSTTFVFSENHISQPRRVSDELFHVTDWMPTLLGAAGAETDMEIDGINQWEMTSNGATGKRQAFVYNIYQNFDNALRSGRMKLIEGHPEGFLRRFFSQRSVEKRDTGTDTMQELDNILKDANVDLQDVLAVLGLKTAEEDRDISADQILDLLLAVNSNSGTEQPVCDCLLYDLKADPTETTDLAAQSPLLVKFLFHILELFKEQEVPLVLKIPPVTIVPEANPLLHDGAISSGWC